MRRRLLTILILLVAGALVNVAVAWGCGYRFRALTHEMIAQGLSEIEVPCWGFELRRWTGTCAIGADALYDDIGYDQSVRQGRDYGRDRLPSWSRMLQPPPPRNSRFDIVNLFEQANGYPLLALSGALRYTITTRPTRTLEVEAITGILARRIPQPALIPLRPIWPGFAVNTVSYALTLWLLLWSVSALRRLIRRRRGLCPACGYDLGHAQHDTCPECGRQQQGLQPGG